MNRIYSLVWNRALRTPQVASEIARPRGGSSAATPLRQHPLALACMVALAMVTFSAPSAWAGSGGGGGQGPIANPVITPANPINFGNMRIGSTQTQALTVTNELWPGSSWVVQQYLDAQLGSASGAATSNGGTITGLAGGSTNDTSMVVGLDTAMAGAQTGSVTMALQSSANFACPTQDCITNLNPYTVNVSGNVYRLANPTLNTSSISLAARVGDAAPMATISVTNTSPDQYTEGLAANLGAAPAGFSVSGSIANLAAQATDNSSLHVALNTATAGSFSGNQAVGFVSNGQIDNATAVSVGSGNVALSGNVYTPAVAQVNTASPIDFGIVHVGDDGGTLSRSISVSNGAAVTALNDTLLGSNTVTNSSGSAFSGTGSLGASGLAAGQTSTAMGVSLNTATAGIYSGTANLAFSSHDNQLADLALAGSSLGVQAQVNNYAKLAFLFGSGTGSLTGSGNSYVFSFGDIKQGNGSVSAGLLFLNDNPVAEQAFTDLLASSGTVASGSGFSLSGDSVSNLAGGNTQGGFNIGFDTAHVGNFNELLSFNVDSIDPGFNGDIGTVTLDLEGTIIGGGVASVPEPGELGLCGLGLLLIGGFMGLRRKRAERREGR